MSSAHRSFNLPGTRSGSQPFWSRTKVGVTAGVLGLIVGFAGSTGDNDKPEPVAAADVETAIEVAVAREVDREVDRVTAEYESRIATQEEAAEKALAEAEAATAAAEAAAADELAAVRKQAKRDQKQAVRKAVAEARKEQAPAVETRPPAPPEPQPEQSSTDPRFSWCYEAKAAGYGPYRRGVDPEYHWYQDRDGDGMVCE